MPELDWRFGYPFAILLMILAAVLPYLFFKRRAGCERGGRRSGCRRSR